MCIKILLNNNYCIADWTILFAMGTGYYWTHFVGESNVKLLFRYRGNVLDFYCFDFWMSAFFVWFFCFHSSLRWQDLFRLVSEIFWTWENFSHTFINISISIYVTEHDISLVVAEECSRVCTCDCFFRVSISSRGVEINSISRNFIVTFLQSCNHRLPTTLLAYFSCKFATVQWR